MNKKSNVTTSPSKSKTPLTKQLSLCPKVEGRIVLIDSELTFNELLAARQHNGTAKQ